MFRGAFEYALDDKNRIAVPPRYREDMSPAGFLTRGWNRCLFLFPWKFWDEIETKLSTLRISDMAGIAIQRFFSSGVECRLDGGGRLAIPADLRKYAGITKDVVIRGCANRLEIWAKEVWQQYDEGQSLEEIVQKAADLGI
jgi:MraZ protein